MLRALIVAAVLSFSFNSQAAEPIKGQKYVEANNIVIDHLRMIEPPPPVSSWLAQFQDGKVSVTALAPEQRLEYICGQEEEVVTCTHQDEKVGAIENLPGRLVERSDKVAYMQKAYQLAVEKFRKTLARRNPPATLDVVKAWKVWTHQPGNSDHDHGLNAWTKITYLEQDKELSAFIVCHTHGGDRLFCHYARSAPGEPSFERKPQ